MKHLKPAALLGALCMLTTVPVTASMQSGSAPAGSDIERVEVLGRKTTPQLQRMMFKAKVDFYETFNAYNDDPKYRVVCRAVRQTGTKIKRKQCQANYVSEAWARLTQAAYTNGLQPEKIPTRDYVEFMLKKEHRSAEKQMVDVAMENPEVMASLREYMALFTRLNERDTD